MIHEAIDALDDRRLPIAEVSRRVGRVAVQHGLVRPSYVHLRRLVRAKREREDVEKRRRDALRAIAAGAAADFAVGRAVHPYDVAARIWDVNARANSELVALSHKHSPRYAEPP